MTKTTTPLVHTSPGLFQFARHLPKVHLQSLTKSPTSQVERANQRTNGRNTPMGNRRNRATGHSAFLLQVHSIPLKPGSSDFSGQLDPTEYVAILYKSRQTQQTPGPSFFAPCFCVRSQVASSETAQNEEPIGPSLQPRNTRGAWDVDSCLGAWGREDVVPQEFGYGH